MQRPTLRTGILLALVVSLVTAPLSVLFSLWLGVWLGTKALIAALAYAYIVYLLVQSERTSGRITLAVLSALILLGSLALPARWSGVLALSLIASLRAWAYSRSLVTGFLHGSLCVLGLGAALWAYRQSGSLVLTVWSFFLLQALYVCIPARLAGQVAGQQAEAAEAEDPFATAHQAAQQALTRLRTRVV